jgi:hypothetical protein
MASQSGASSTAAQSGTANPTLILFFMAIRTLKPSAENEDHAR